MPQTFSTRNVQIGRFNSVVSSKSSAFAYRGEYFNEALLKVPQTKEMTDGLRGFCNVSPRFFSEKIKGYCGRFFDENIAAEKLQDFARLPLSLELPLKYRFELIAVILFDVCKRLCR